MFLGLAAALTSGSAENAVFGAPGIFDLLGDRQGVAIDFVARRMRINDAGNPANTFDGDPEAKLTVHGSDGFLYDPVKGLAVDAARDFSIALATSRFPYDPSACTVLIRYELNAATSGDQRYLFMIDNSGTDRFAMYSIPGDPFRFVTGDGSSADIQVSDFGPVADTPLAAIFGADQFGKTLVDDGGLQADTNDTLMASDPGFVGIGGYPDRVLRVLDGHIREVLILCEPVEKQDRLSLEPPAPPASGSEPAPEAPSAFGVLGGRHGFAIDFVAGAMKINDRDNSANTFEGDPAQKLTHFGDDPMVIDPAKGLVLDATRDFGAALETALFPYNPTACTVYAKFYLNSPDAVDQRYIYMADNSGQDRFALYSTPGAPFRFVTGDGVDVDIAVSDLDPVAGTALEVVFGADATGKSYVDHGGVQADTAATLNAFVPTYVGIGGWNDRVLRVLDGHLAEIVVITETLPREVRLTLPPLGSVYRAEGDSHTFNTNAAWGVQPEEFYPARVADALGSDTVMLNLGGSGDSSAEMVHQLPTVLEGAIPDIATIYAGANDGPIDIVADVAPTTSTFAVPSNLAARLEPGGHVTVNGEATTISARNGAEITVSPPLSSAPSPGDTVDIDTERSLVTWVNAVKAAGCQRILVLGFHFVNFANGGDQLNSEHPTRAALRAKQAAAAAATGMPYCNTYAFMRDSIAAGDIALGDDLAWHVGVGNTHLNAAGEAAVAEAVIARMTELGWI